MIIPIPMPKNIEREFFINGPDAPLWLMAIPFILVFILLIWIITISAKGRRLRKEADEIRERIKETLSNYRKITKKGKRNEEIYPHRRNQEK